VSGVLTIVVAGVAFLVGLAGLAGLAGHAGPSSVPSRRAAWSAVLGLAGAGLAAGALLVQDEAPLGSWLVALPTGAALSVVHGRALFAAGGPFRT
jgi:hypothetical protein